MYLKYQYGLLLRCCLCVLYIAGLSVRAQSYDSDWSWVSMGEIAFADTVIWYDPGAPGENTGDEPAVAFQNPRHALGLPDHSPDSSRIVALGNGGSVILKFLDNMLFDGPGPDLCVWMPDNPPEEAIVFISTDGLSFKRAGTVSAESRMLDIHAVADPGVFYPIIKIRDNLFQEAPDTSSRGADIDAVCAVHTCGYYEFAADRIFIYLSDQLQTDVKTNLSAVIQAIQTHRNVQVLIEAHTTSGGTGEFNLLLSQQWARALRDYLQIDLGLSARFTAVGMGSNRPAAINHSSDQHRNGRIVILLQYEK